MTSTAPAPRAARTRLRGLTGLIALALVLWTNVAALAQPVPNVLFRHLSVDDGLSHEAVHSVLQDSQGLLWIGTQDGLNRYDGYDITVFTPDPHDPDSLANGWISCLFEDRAGNVWVGTNGGGLHRFLRDRGVFERFSTDPTDPFSISHNSVRVIYEDRAGLLWVGTDGGGLNRLDPESERFTRFAHNPSNPGSLSDDRVRAITEDGAGALWVGTDGGGISILAAGDDNFGHLRYQADTPYGLSADRVRVIRATTDGAIWVGTYENGLDRFDPATGRFSHFTQSTGGPAPLVNGRIRDLLEDSTGALWVATDGGLSRWISDARGFANFAHNPVDSRSLSDDRVTTLVEDAGGVLWVGTYNGLNKWNVAAGAFELYRRDGNALDGLGSDVVNAFTEDTHGNIWIGTYAGGLARMDAETGKLTRFVNDPDDPSSLSDDRVMALYADEEDHIWIGTFETGLDRLDPRTGQFRHYQHDPNDSTTISANGVTVIEPDRAGSSLWVGTYRGGLNQLDPDTGRFVHFRHAPDNPASLGSDSVLALQEDETGALWIGTDGAGVDRFDRRSGTFSHFRHQEDDPTSLSGNTASAIHQDSHGGLWIGTQGGGLNYWHPADRGALYPSFRWYGPGEGLASNNVYGILEDDVENLWISTSRGLTRLTPSTDRTKTYGNTHGLQGNDFMFGAYFQSRDGRMFFGGSNGFNVFRPSEVQDNRHAPPVILTEFLKFNRPVVLGPRPDDDPIQLSYRDSVIGFEFAALDFAAPDQNTYRYRLDGFESEWNDVGDVRRATYTNLGAGEYTFRVQASNNDGVWNEDGLSVALKVGSPPWLSWWAILVYTLIGIGAIAVVARHQSRRRERQAEYSHRLEREVAARTDELASQNRQLAGLNTKLQEVSVTDSLTGLWNRRYLANEIPKDLAVISRARVDYREFAPDDPRQKDPSLLFLMMDLDGLKGVNDTYGHKAGDEVIIKTKEILVRVCRDSDTLIRWGGDEFLLVGRQTDRTAAAGLSDRLRHAIASHRFELDNGDTVRLSCSVGFSFYPFMRSAPTLFSWEQVLDLADRALYRAKQGGRNQWVGVVGAPDADPALAFRRKDEDLDRLAGDGLLELHAGCLDPAKPDHTDHVAHTRSTPQLVEHAS